MGPLPQSSRFLTGLVALVLVGIFYVQTVEGRERRAEQAAQAALRVIERQRKRAL